MIEKKDSVKIDHLYEDIPLPRQRFVCFSFMTPERIKGCKFNAVKVRGVYETYEEAQNRVKQLQKEDPIHDIFIGDVGKWHMVTNDLKMAEDVEYREEELQKLAKGYKENMEEAARMEQERKRDLIKKGDYNDRPSPKDSAVAHRMRQKLEEKKSKEKMLEQAKEQLDNIDHNKLTRNQRRRLKEKEKKRLELESELKSKQDIAKQESERLKVTRETVENEESELKETNHNIKKIKKLFDQYKQKRAAAEK